MPTRRKGGKCMRIALVIYTPLLWLAGMAMIFLGIWMLVDPRRTYILDIVNFSEDDPLLVFAAYVSISAGIASLIVGFVSCCAALKRMRCMLATLILCLLVLFLCGIAIGILALIFRDKFPNEDRLRVYLTNMTHNRYSRDKWVMPLLDTIQFYVEGHSFTASLRFMMKHEYGVMLHLQRNSKVTLLIDKLQFHEECCGVSSSADWKESDWAVDTGGDESDGKGIWKDSPMEYSPVPRTCCKLIGGSSPFDPVPKSLARCLQKEVNRAWRHVPQQCCGGTSGMDYKDSFWYITNTERGTISFVPRSCCRQTQAARAWNIQPVDPLCNTYDYRQSTYQLNVHDEGCAPKLYKWFNEQTAIFAAFGFTFAGLQVIGIIIALLLCSNIRYYYEYVKEDDY